MSKILGYQVHEVMPDEPMEQVLVLRTGSHLPEGGILDWPNQATEARSVFPDRKSARAAIIRTNHYRLAFGTEMHPDQKWCRVVAVKAI